TVNGTAGGAVSAAAAGRGSGGGTYGHLRTGETSRVERSQVQVGPLPGDHLGDEVTGGRGQPDPGALVPVRVDQPGGARVGADHRQVVRGERPEAVVDAHQADPGERREEGDRAGRQPPDRLDVEAVVEADELPGRADEDRAGRRPLHHGGGLQARLVAGDVVEVVGGVDLVADQQADRLGDEDDAPARGQRYVGTGRRGDLTPRGPRVVDVG